jgi:hypothetical protein
MCTGQKPFAGDTVTAVSFQVVFEAPARTAQLKPGLPAELDAILSRCLAKKPEDRYKSCGELAADLEALKAGRSIRSRNAAAPPAVERTAAVPPVPAAAAQASRTLEKTRAVPASTGEERNRLVSTLLASAVPAGSRAAHRHLWLAGTAAAMLLAVAGSAYWFRRGAEASPPAAATPAAAPAVSAPAPPPRQPVATEASGSAVRPEKPAVRSEKPVPRSEKPTAPAAFATLRIDCKHNFRSASLEIYVDDELLFKSALRGKEHNYGVMKAYEGKVNVERPIPVGTHSLRVWVISRRDDYDDQEAVQGEFSEGGTRTLEIEFGKGSAIVGRKLDLTLH